MSTDKAHPDPRATVPRVDVPPGQVSNRHRRGFTNASTARESRQL